MKKGFTLIEILIVIGILLVLAITVVIAINPGRLFAEARDSRREADILAIKLAAEQRIHHYGVWDCPEAGPLPFEFTTIGTGVGQYDLFACLFPKFLFSKPIDPFTGTLENTRYQIGQDPLTRRIALQAPDSELRTIAIGPRVLRVAWLNDFSFRRPIIISNAGSILIDYQVLITLDTASLIAAGKMRSDGGDIRFTDSDRTTKIPYWIESGINTASTKIWVRVPSIPTGDKLIYVYYGNPTTVSESNGAATFEFFDDFKGTALDPRWHVAANSFTVVDGILRINVGGIGLVNALPFRLQDRYKVEARTLFNTVVGSYSGGIPNIGSYRFTMGGNAAAAANILFMRRAGHRNVSLYAGDGSVTGYNLGGGVFTGWTSTDNTWYRTGISVIGGTARLWRDGTNIHFLTGVSWAKDLRFITLGVWDGTPARDIQDTSYDWVKVRKFTDIEPTTNVGAEEGI